MARLTTLFAIQLFLQSEVRYLYSSSVVAQLSCTWNQSSREKSQENWGILTEKSLSAVPCFALDLGQLLNIQETTRNSYRCCLVCWLWLASSLGSVRFFVWSFAEYRHLGSLFRIVVHSSISIDTESLSSTYDHKWIQSEDGLLIFESPRFARSWTFCILSQLLISSEWTKRSVHVTKPLLWQTYDCDKSYIKNGLLDQLH
jgi:hypothetical protein